MPARYSFFNKRGTPSLILPLQRGGDPHLNPPPPQSGGGGYRRGRIQEGEWLAVTD